MSKISEQRDEQAAVKQGPRWSWLLLGLALAAFAWGIYYFAYYRNSPRRVDTFAQCLTSKGAKMYGAWWCPHCADEKKLFGNGFQYVNYVECSPPGQRTQNEVCKQAGIKNYPTWQFAEGSRTEGTQPLAALSKKTGCRLP
jgi:hypothetical protein